MGQEVAKLCAWGFWRVDGAQGRPFGFGRGWSVGRRFQKVTKGYTLNVFGGLGDVWFMFNKLFSNAEC
jgi:hypothetical protein